MFLSLKAFVRSLINVRSKGVLVDIECHSSNSLPNIIIVGFANKTVDESKERIRVVFANSQVQLPRKRISINLAPADVPKASSSLDVAIATAILAASEQIKRRPSPTEAIIGELGLDGTIRPVRGIIGKLLSGRKKGIRTFFIPTANLDQAKVVPGIRLIPLHDFRELYSGQLADRNWRRRALEIAAAGAHNILLNGLPGTGKSMLAKALPAILPPLSHEEMLEVTHLHSLANLEYEHLVSERPFRWKTAPSPFRALKKLPPSLPISSLSLPPTRVRAATTARRKPANARHTSSITTEENSPTRCSTV